MMADLISLFRVSDELCVRVALTLLHFTWQGVLIGAGAAFVNRWLHRHSATVRYNIFVTAMVAMPVVAAATFLMIDTNELSTSQATELLGDEKSLNDSRAISDVAQSPQEMEQTVSPIEAESIQYQLNVGIAETPPLAFGIERIARQIVLIYGVGACFFLARLGLAIWGGHRLRATARRIADSELLDMISDQARLVGLRFVPMVGYCERIAVPTVIGVTRPFVLLPTILMGLDVEHLATIVSHEFAHIRRADLLVNLAQRLVESFFFFHPVTWYVSKRVNMERELCCDDLVVATGQRLPYAAALLEMAEICLAKSRVGGPALAIDGKDSSELERRIRRIIDAKPIPRLRLTRLGISAFLCLLVGAIAIPGAMKSFATADDQPREEQTASSNPNDDSVDENAATDSARGTLQAAIDDINETIVNHPIADAAPLLTVESVLKGISEAVPKYDLSEKDINAIDEIVRSQHLPKGVSLRHFVRYLDAEYVRVGSWVRLIMERESEPPLVLPIREQAEFARPRTQLERQFRQQVEQSGMPTLGRMVSFFDQDVSIQLSDVSGQTVDMSKVSNLFKSVSKAVQQKDANALLRHFHWDGVGEIDPLRSFVKSEVQQIIDSGRTRISFMSKKFVGTILHHQGFREFAPNGPIFGYLSFSDGKFGKTVLELTDVGGEAKFVCYVVSKDRSANFLGKKLSSNVSVSGAMSALADGSYESMTTLRAPDELSALRQANFEIWKHEPRPTPTVAIGTPDKQSAVADATETQRDDIAPSAHPVTIQCSGPAGKPIVGAEVHLFQFTGGVDRRYEHLGPITSDATGKASVAGARFTNALGDFDRWVYARIPGKLVGVSRSRRTRRSNTIHNAETTVTLYPSRTVQGKVSVPTGFDPRDVTVTTRVLHVMTGNDDLDYESFPREFHFSGLHDALPEIFERRPDANGNIQFDDVPVRGHLYLVTAGKGLGEAQWWNGWKPPTFETPIEISIEEERRIRGQVLSPSGGPAANVEVRARIASGASYSSTFRTTTDGNGKFMLKGLPDNELSITVSDPNDRWTFRPRHKERGELGKGRELNLQMESTIRVTGRVVDSDGKPVARAAISAVVDVKNGAGLGDTMTDETGRYELQLPPGQALLYFNSLPDGYAYPEPQVIKRLEIRMNQEPIESLDFTLKRKDATEN